MAWVEQRSTRTPHWRVVWREGDRRETVKFPTAAQAEYYRQLISANAERQVGLPLPEAVAAGPVQPAVAMVTSRTGPGAGSTRTPARGRRQW